MIYYFAFLTPDLIVEKFMQIDRELSFEIREARKEAKASKGLDRLEWGYYALQCWRQRRQANSFLLELCPPNIMQHLNN